MNFCLNIPPPRLVIGLICLLLAHLVYKMPNEHILPPPHLCSKNIQYSFSKAVLEEIVAALHPGLAVNLQRVLLH